MRIQCLRSIAGKAGVFVAALLTVLTLSSCGGGGITSNPLVAGSLSILPGTGTLYGNIPFNFTIAGGTPPYFITSDQQLVLPVNMTITGHTFTVIPANPGVIDAGLPPDSLPIRTVNMTVRDGAGAQVSNPYQIAQNFATGYSFNISSLGGCGSDACAGTESLVSIRPTHVGALQGRRQLRFDVLAGQFGFIIDGAPGSPGNTVGPSFTVTTDDTGDATVRLFAFSTAITQFATFRFTDVLNGGYQDVTFVIQGAPISPLAVLPTTMSVTGPDSSTCGSGSSNVIVSGGVPPYTATSSQPGSILVSPSTVSSSGGSFTIVVLALAAPNCPNGVVQIIDSVGQTASVSVTSSVGSAAPAQPFSVTRAPEPICLSDPLGPSPSTTIFVSGGNANKVLSSNNVALATVNPLSGSGNFSATITAVGIAPVGPGVSVAITIGDGANSAAVGILRKTTCP